MNTSYEWLRAFVPFDETPTQLRDLITARVTTVDELVPLRQDLAPIVIARVVEEAAHPDSDHLHVTKVDMGTGVLLDVVCGAHNVTAGKLYPFAPVGTTMPNGLKIQKRKIRGATSEGMLCSPDELLLGSDHDGIMELDIDVPPGTPFLKAVSAGDMQIVIDVGANRPDLLSHLGVAREIAAITGKPLTLPVIPSEARDLQSSDGAPAGPSLTLGATVEDPSLVHRFMGVVIRGLKVGPSPEWLVKRIESVGGRSINNVVDASNYVLHELGQPTHAFDLAKLAGPEIRVRLARAGEKITTLDGQERSLTPEMIVIADAERPQAVAGVMGGRDSEVTESTTDVFLEVANFEASRIRTARRALGLNTDASYRFERGVDVEIAPIALQRVADIIREVAGGTMVGAPTDIRRSPAETRTVSLRVSRVEALLGDAVPAADVARLLGSVGFQATGSGDALSVAVPSWRGDVQAEVDLIEEVARLRGYDSFPNEIRAFRPGNVPDDPTWLISKRIRDALVGAGFLELRPMPFVAGDDATHTRVKNPLAENEAHLRRTVLETLARRAEYNLSHMQGSLRIFEIGSAFIPEGKRLPREELRVAALVMGRRTPPHFTDPKSEEFEKWARFGEWDAKSLGELVCREAFGNCRSLPSVGSTGWDLEADGRVVGSVSSVALDAPVWAAPAWGIEITLATYASDDVAPVGHHSYETPTYLQPRGSAYRALPSTPASEFDLALLVPVDRTAHDVEAKIRQTAGDLLERIELFDRYAGKGVDPGYRSLAWRLTFRHPERTLRDKEIEGRRAKILSVLDTELNVRPRTN